MTLVALVATIQGLPPVRADRMLALLAGLLKAEAEHQSETDRFIREAFSCFDRGEPQPGAEAT